MCKQCQIIPNIAMSTGRIEGITNGFTEVIVTLRKKERLL